MNLPAVALSVRQPWAWFIVNGFKDVENRTWRTSHRGPLLIHASAWWNRAEARETIGRIVHAARMCGIMIPAPSLEDLLAQVGGIVGVATVTDCIQGVESMWAEPGAWHWTLADAHPLPFRRCPGRLNIFRCTYTAPDAGQGGVLA